MSWLKAFFKFREKQHDGELVKPFLDHMEDLRWTLIRLISTLMVGLVIAFFYVDKLTEIMYHPLRQVAPGDDSQLQVIGVTEPFMASLTVAFFAAIVFTFPLLVFFLADFILPALTKKEKRVLVPGILAAFVLFAAGASACYFLILPQTLEFFRNYAHKMHADPRWRMGEYFSFVTHLTLAFGALCEVPIVMIVLALLGVVSYELLQRTRMYAYIIVMLLVAFVAPTPDPITFLSLSFPVILLYEGCIWIVWLLDRRRMKREAAERLRQEREDEEWRQKRFAEEQEREKREHDAQHDEPGPSPPDHPD